MFPYFSAGYIIVALKNYGIFSLISARVQPRAPDIVQFNRELKYV